MQRRRTFNHGRPRSLYSLAQQPRSRPTTRKPNTWPPPHHGTCRNCGKVGMVEVHHAVPRSLSRAGRDDPRNWLRLCAECHRAWHAGTPISREVFTEQQWAFVSSLMGPGWLGRRYPRTDRAAA